jgi:hypothetical protein
MLRIGASTTRWLLQTHGARADTRLLSSRAAAATQLDRIARFTDTSGDEFFGVFTDASESRARVASRGEDGRLSIGTEEREVDMILPPLEPPAVYCIGRA